MSQGLFVTINHREFPNKAVYWGIICRTHVKFYEGYLKESEKAPPDINKNRMGIQPKEISDILRSNAYLMGSWMGRETMKKRVIELAKVKEDTSKIKKKDATQGTLTSFISITTTTKKKEEHNNPNVTSFKANDDESIKITNKGDEMFSKFNSSPKMPTGVTMPNSAKLCAWVADKVEKIYVFTETYIHIDQMETQIRRDGYFHIDHESSFVVNLFLRKCAKRMALDHVTSMDVPVFICGPDPKKNGNFRWVSLRWEDMRLRVVIPTVEMLNYHPWNMKFTVLSARTSSLATSINDTGLYDVMKTFLGELRKRIIGSEINEAGLPRVIPEPPPPKKNNAQDEKSY